MAKESAKELDHYVGGKRVKGAGGRFGDVFNPATGEVSGRVPLASADEVRAAVKVAADYSELGWLLITIAVIELCVPLVVILLVQRSRLRTTQ